MVWSRHIIKRAFDYSTSTCRIFSKNCISMFHIMDFMRRKYKPLQIFKYLHERINALEKIFLQWIRKYVRGVWTPIRAISDLHFARLSKACDSKRGASQNCRTKNVNFVQKFQILLINSRLNTTLYLLSFIYSVCCIAEMEGDTFRLHYDGLTNNIHKNPNSFFLSY